MILSLTDESATKVEKFMEKTAMPFPVGVGTKSKKDYGVRYYGFPFGHEFPAFIDDIVDVSTGESGLSANTQERLSSLAAPIHLRVFSTPT